MAPVRLAPSRPCWQRVVALCLAVWFVAVATDLPVMRACAMHCRGAGVVSTMADDAGHHAGMAGMCHDAEPTADVSPAATSGAGVHRAPGPDDAAPATRRCLGHCCGAAAVTALHAVVVPLSAPDAPVPPAPGRSQHEYVAAWVDFVLPFSTAPPRA